jgi:hypothetical protein
MCAPPSDEAIPNPISPTQEDEDEVSHFPFQVFDDTLFYDSEGERESLDELDPLYYEVEEVREIHEDKVLRLVPPFNEFIQTLEAFAQEEVHT